MKREPSPVPGASGEEPPAVPGFSRWSGVYLFVLGTFVAVVIALLAFQAHFS